MLLSTLPLLTEPAEIDLYESFMVMMVLVSGLWPHYLKKINRFHHKVLHDNDVKSFCQ